MDHAFLRVWWTNLYQVVPGVWRSNQPSPKRVKRYKEMGIETILYLRGYKPNSFYLLEKEMCDAVGIKMVRVEMAARNAPKPKQLIALLDIFDTIEKPFLMHCKSGADRAGLAAALYMLYVEKVSLAKAREQLSRKYLHLKSTRTGILDLFLDVYEADTKDAPMPIREWIETRYDRDALTASFAEKRGKAA
ncbi:fused DSP-PTPase phosphatase/NAD kinase-like protein [Actibacterium pelagium]|nr:tyrosine-protein phosphatase [Actibacterium pelagium]